ncbi:FAD-dependent oxidoreductase [Terrimesophilobacter mesophilus]|uniref:FAD-dependent oxidoreductase n=1 Tax=Terrimesophilobacter mesophilus TaxID=433647 RepID=A0A4R8VG68_9MICO|nr:FAD-dependent oxidoreductase [Terrimesophilobacter mesophilus]
MSLPAVKLLAKEAVASNTMSFRFEKPTGFEYTAGQFADYTLLNPPETDAEGDIRGFSFSSAPFEPFLQATTRLRDTAFKHVLRDAAIGTEVLLDAPWGSFTLHHKVERPAVFLTGGIGITPARSIVLQSVHDVTGHSITVFDSNHTPQEAAFLDELTRVAAENDRITYVPTMSGLGDSRHQWAGETGHIDAAMLSRYVDDLAAPIYYVCGPGAMVKAMRGVLDAAGVDSDDIRTEEFTGY